MKQNHRKIAHINGYIRAGNVRSWYKAAFQVEFCFTVRIRYALLLPGVWFDG